MELVLGVTILAPHEVPPTTRDAQQACNRPLSAALNGRYLSCDRHDEHEGPCGYRRYVQPDEHPAMRVTSA